MSIWKTHSLRELSVKQFDQAIHLLLVMLLFFMPLAFGVVQAWSEEVVLSLTAAILIVFLLRLGFAKDARFIWSWAYIPLVLFVLVVLFQLIPLPARVVSAISPNTITLKRELLYDLPNVKQALARITLSFYPYATKHDLRLALAVTTIFIVVLNVYRRPNQIKRLLGVVAGIGGGIILLTLAQDIFGNGKIYWFVSIPDNRVYSGPFVNHSHYGQFMNLSIGAALSLIMVKLHEAFWDKKITPLSVGEWLTSPQVRILWALVIMVILGVVTVFMSLTRGGMVSMLIAGTLTTLLLSSRQSLKGRGWIMALMALGAFICVLSIGFDVVYDRLATFRDVQAAEGGRWQTAKDISVILAKFPLLGTGLGTHEVIYPMFDRSTNAALSMHADNEYAQMAEEIGLAGLLILLAFFSLVWVVFIKNFMAKSIPIRSAIYGLGFGLIAIMIHSLSDFGQHLPAIATLTAIFCALLLVLNRIDEGNSSPTEIARASSARVFTCIAILLGLCPVFGWSLYDADRARRAEAHWEKALIAEQSLMAKDWQGSDTEYIDLISHAAAASDLQPDNVHYSYWLNLYRWRSISREIDLDTGQFPMEPQTLQFAGRIVDELHKARTICPTFGPIYCVAGQIEKWVLNDERGAEHIKIGHRLSPCNPTACLSVGMLSAGAGEVEAACQQLSRAVELQSSFYREAAAICVNSLNRPDVAVALAGDDTYRLSLLVDILTESEDHKPLEEQTRSQVAELLKLKCTQQDAPASAFASLAWIYVGGGNKEAAIENYRRALNLNYGQVDWRFNLARLLADVGAIPEAIHEARICLRLRPHFEEARKLIEDLSIHQEAVQGVSRAE